MPCVMTSERWRKWQCVVGGFCAMCIAGQFYIIGNVGTYLESYLKERGDYPQEATWLIPSLVTCVFAGGQVGMAVGGYLDRVIGPQLTTLLGTSLLIVGAALTCWTLHVSSVSVLVTFGAVPSVGFGCAYGSVYSALNKHNFHNLGIMYGIVNSGFGGGAVLFNFVISAFVNPENMAPDKVHSQGRHFSQADILNKVPHSMLLLSGLYVVLFPAVVWGLRPPPPPSSSSSQGVDIDVILTDVTAPGSRPAEDSLLKGDDCTSYQALRSQDTTLEALKQNGEGGRRGDDRGGGGGGGTGGGGTGGGETGEALTPLQLFRCRTFYILWVMVLLAGFANNPVVGYYKELGLTAIHNDILLASMGTVGSLMSAVCRPLWGVLADLTSIKTMAIVNFSLSSIFLAFWRGALLEGEALYYLFTVLLFSWVSGLPVMLVLTCQRYFGSAHQVANLSVLWTAMTLESCLLPLITPVTLKEYGWDGLLLFLTLTSIAGLLVSLWLPRERSSDVTKGSVPADKVHKCNTGS